MIFPLVPIRVFVWRKKKKNNLLKRSFGFQESRAVKLYTLYNVLKLWSCCLSQALMVVKSPLPSSEDYWSIKSGFLPLLWVFITVQCCKITGFPLCFLLFMRFAMETWSRSMLETQGFPAKPTLRNP